jgi:hypothetical protein
VNNNLADILETDIAELSVMEYIQASEILEDERYLVSLVSSTEYLE